MNRQFWATVYKADNAFYGPSGKSLAINCDHINVGVFGLNSEGQAVPLPNATTHTLDTSPPTDILAPQVGVPAGEIFPNTAQPGLDLKKVVQIKDMVELATYYVDYDSYYAKVVQCNPVS